MLNSIKKFLKENKILLLFVLIWLILYIYGNITFLRIIIFICIFIYIYLYKKLLNYVSNIILNEDIIYILLWIDNLKLIIYHLFFFIYTILYDLKFKYELEWLSEKLTKIFEYFIVFPYYVIMHKYYKVLQIWKNTSLNKIILLRFYGIIISILVFSPLLGLIWEFLNKNFIYCYLIFVLIIYIHENLKSLLKYKYFNILKYILLLNILIEPPFIFSYRNEISIFVILIKNTINTLYKNQSKTNKFTFNINEIYLSMFSVSINLGKLNLKLDEKEHFKLSKRYIYNYQENMKGLKIVSVRKTIINKNKFIFEHILGFYFSSLEDIFKKLTDIKYAKIKSKELNLDINKLQRMETFIKYLIEVLLFYLLDLSLTFRNIEEIKEDLQFDKEGCLFDLNYNQESVLLFLKEKNINKWREVTWEIDLYEYKNYYELVYIYMNLLDLYTFKNYAIDCENYIYIDILLSDLSILEIKNDRKNLDIYILFPNLKYVPIRYMLEVEDESYENTQLGDLTKDLKNLKKELDNYREELLKKWEGSIYELNKENFYKRNMERLKNLDDYVLEEIKNRKR